MLQRRHAIRETRDFSKFLRPLKPIPARVETAIARGVQSGTDCHFSEARLLIEPMGDGLVDAVVRNSDGVLVVACLTEMPGVTPEMWDWWFGWHGLASERYLLWHPRDHVSNAMAEDRSHLKDTKAKYIGNTSFVAERIGDEEVHKLEIAFLRPGDVGISEAELALRGTAICARGGLQGKFVDVSYLIHFVRRTSGGSEMLSRFWLGHVKSKHPCCRLVYLEENEHSRSCALKVTPDAFGLRLLRHCSEEMNHLASFLPELYAAYGNE